MTYALHVATSMPRAGRRFEPIQERELHADALQSAEALPGARRGLVVVPEFSGPLGVPDFTAFVGNLGSLRLRQGSVVSPVLNEIDAGVLAVAHVRRPLDADDLAAALGWPVATIAGRLRRLVISGALTEPSRGRYLRAPEVQPHGRLYAIEAKVEDWRSALRQARAYRVWADSYVLVMTKLSERSLSELRGEVAADRGGLVFDGRWIVRPRLGAVSRHRQLQAAEMFAAATRTGLNPPPFGLGVSS